MQQYDKEIYEYYLGQKFDVDEFLKGLDRKRYHQQLDYYWSKHLGTEKEAAILDLGCGWGDFLLFLKGKGFQNLYGIDANSQSVEVANKLGLNQVVLGDLFEILDQFISEGRTFKVISAFNLLEHIEKNSALILLKKVSTLLCDGGKLLLEIPNANSNFGARTRYWDFTHKVSFTPTSVDQILKVTGYKNIEFQEKIAVPKNLTGKIRRLLWKLIKLKTHFYLLVEQGNIGIDIFSQDMHVIATK